MNSEKLFTSEREKVLNRDNMRDAIVKMITDVVENEVDTYIGDNQPSSEWDLAGLNQSILEIMPIKLSLTKDEILNLSKAEFKQTLKAAAVKLYEDKEAEFPEPEQIREIERIVLLKVIDRKWMGSYR